MALELPVELNEVLSPNETKWQDLLDAPLVRTNKRVFQNYGDGRCRFSREQHTNQMTHRAKWVNKYDKDKVAPARFRLVSGQEALDLWRVEIYLQFYEGRIERWRSDYADAVGLLKEMKKKGQLDYDPELMPSTSDNRERLQAERCQATVDSSAPKIRSIQAKYDTLKVWMSEYVQPFVLERDRGYIRDRNKDVYENARMAERAKREAAAELDAVLDAKPEPRKPEFDDEEETKEVPIVVEGENKEPADTAAR